MVSAFDELNKEGMSSEHVRTDKGKEFLGDMKNWFKAKHMNHFGTQNETKANYAEKAKKNDQKENSAVHVFQTVPSMGRYFRKGGI